jgi:hypothetical protein
MKIPGLFLTRVPLRIEPSKVIETASVAQARSVTITALVSTIVGMACCCMLGVSIVLSWLSTLLRQGN